METTRQDGRGSAQLRPVTITNRFQRNPEGSVLYRCGGTLVLVAASVEEQVPPWLKGQGRGWVTAEYAMHPRANPERQKRDGRRGSIDGRTAEIQRLIARSLRAAVHLDKLGERMITIDCDVLDADGGTRTASITGGFVALATALDRLRRDGIVPPGVVRAPIAAISVGTVNGKHLLDLAYAEDSQAEVDLNVVATERGGIVEVQGTAEGAPIPRADFDALLDLALGAMPQLAAAQRAALAEAGVDLAKLMA
ncbi:MAG TPA: ribonuclease PH [Sandaracinaceae bacterium]